MGQRDAKRTFANIGETFKVEIIEDVIPENEEVSVYRQGDWFDVCRGPHLQHWQVAQGLQADEVGRCLRQGNSDNEMLQRIYGTAWRDKKELNAHLHRLEEAEKRDHRKLGRKLDLFHFSDEAPGSVFWHPKGWALFLKLIDYMRKRQDEAGYIEVNTPDVMDRSLWETSGHWFNYRENMFPPRQKTSGSSP